MLLGQKITEHEPITQPALECVAFKLLSAKLLSVGVTTKLWVRIPLGSFMRGWLNPVESAGLRTRAKLKRAKLRTKLKSIGRYPVP